MYQHYQYQHGRLCIVHKTFFSRPGPHLNITKTNLFKYTENFTTKKNENFQIKIMILFLFLLKNTDCGYSLEPPRRGGSNEYPQSMF